MQKAPPLQHFLSCSYAGIAAQAHGLGKRVLSNEYIHSGGSGMSQSGNWGLAVWPHELKNAPSCNRIFGFVFAPNAAKVAFETGGALVGAVATFPIKELIGRKDKLGI